LLKIAIIDSNKILSAPHFLLSAYGGFHVQN